MICDKCKKESSMCMSRDNSFDVWCYDCTTKQTARIDEIIKFTQNTGLYAEQNIRDKLVEMLEKLKGN